MVGINCIKLLTLLTNNPLLWPTKWYENNVIIHFFISFYSLKKFLVVRNHSFYENEWTNLEFDNKFIFFFFFFGEIKYLYDLHFLFSSKETKQVCKEFDITFFEKIITWIGKISEWNLTHLCLMIINREMCKPKSTDQDPIILKT